MDDLKNTMQQAQRLGAGDEQAATELFQRFSERVLRLAERQIGARLKPRVDPEDVMISVFDRVLGGIRGGKYKIDQTGDLWRLMFRVTLTTAKKKAIFHRQSKRDVSKEAGNPASSDCDIWQNIAGRENVEETLVVVYRELQPQLLSQCKGRTREAVKLFLDGYQIEEIAKQLGCSRWTVRRCLDEFGRIVKNRLKLDEDEDS